MPALEDLNAIAEYIALDDPRAACRFVARTFDRVERLGKFPNSGKRPPELGGTPYREVVVPPCRVFYRVERGTVHILHVMRSERLLRSFMIEERDRQK